MIDMTPVTAAASALAAVAAEERATEQRLLDMARQRARRMALDALALERAGAALAVGDAVPEMDADGLPEVPVIDAGIRALTTHKATLAKRRAAAESDMHVARAAVAATLQQDALAKLDAAMDAMFDAWATLRAADKIAAESGRPAADTPNGPTMRIPLPPAIAKRVAEKRQHHPGWFSTEEIQHRVPAAHAALTSQLALDALLKETTDVEA